MLNKMRCGLWRRRQDTPPLQIAARIVAGAAPKSIAAAMKNVSETDTFADTDAIFIVKTPETIASTPNSRHAAGCGVWTSAKSDRTMVAAPSAATT